MFVRESTVGNMKKNYESTIEGLHKKIGDLEQELLEARNMKELLEKIVERTGVPVPEYAGNYVITSGLTGITMSNITSCFTDDIAQYVDDYFGGKVIKQEATPVTILDENGKATYGVTKKLPRKGEKYILVKDEKVITKE